jgi:hypothetical protein
LALERICNSTDFIVQPSHPRSSRRVALPAVICPFCPVTAERSYKKEEDAGQVPVGSTVVVELTEKVADNIEKMIAKNIYDK